MVFIILIVVVTVRLCVRLISKDTQMLHVLFYESIMCFLLKKVTILRILPCTPQKKKQYYKTFTTKVIMHTFSQYVSVLRF